MPLPTFKIKLLYLVILTLLLVGLVPLLLTGWLLSGRSARELRSVENRYQIQLVQEKARQIEMFAQRYGDLVLSVANSIQLANDPQIINSPATEKRLGQILQSDPNVLALYIKPVNGESLSIFRREAFGTGELETIISDTGAKLTTQELLIGQPVKLSVNGDYAMTMASQVTIADRTVATVISVVSLKDISRNIVGVNPTAEDQLWQAGLPIIFVVDQNGTAIFHPDPSLVDAKRPLTSLKIVNEWLESNSQIQSGLVPFTANYKGTEHQMIGAYSTAMLGKNMNLGVIAMQDEAKALASVSEMRWQTWMISLAFAMLALIVGVISARLLTNPIYSLSEAAKKIAGGDLTTRVATSSIAEIGTLGSSFNSMTDELQGYIAKLANAARENRELFVGTVKALAAAIDGKDKYTRGHSERVARISVAIGRQLGLSEDEIEKLRISALLHDIGKIAIDDSILKKPAALTDEEYEIMKTHPQKGYKIMSQIPAMKDFLPGMYMHHEMVNGQGYPQGLKGDEIPLQAKIVSVADTFDAMTIDRPYSKGMLLDEALERIRSFVGTRYDAEVVEALVRGCMAGEIGQGVVRYIANTHEAATKDSADNAQKVA
ncbi:MAG: HD domain-containing phosphohydrolase [Acidobacteriota bacterium]